MPKFEIYSLKDTKILTIVDANDWDITKDGQRVCFIDRNIIIAEFVLNNISGFKEVR